VEAALSAQVQLETLLAKGYPALAGLTEEEFAGRLRPLRQVARERAWMEPLRGGWVPFLLVVSGELVGVEQSMPLTRLAGGDLPGFVDRLFAPVGVDAFQPLCDLGIPGGAAYLLVDVERGEQFGNVAPDAALATITGRGRSPLTVEEGVALITQYPHLLEQNKCFSLAGSRAGDRRVPELWISKRTPRLGWCWAGTPHTWLGLASAGDRAGVAADAPTLAGV
jgi:hypothetical protein